MLDLRDLYQEVIIDHNRNPRNYHTMAEPQLQAEGFNPLCGDHINLFLKVENDTITDVGFTGCGCAISTASASLMTEQIKQKTLSDAETLFQQFHAAIMSENNESPEKLGKLAVLLGVKQFPVRVKCATLAWHTLEAALKRSEHAVSTES